MTNELAVAWPGDATLAPFATGVYALDETHPRCGRPHAADPARACRSATTGCCPASCCTAFDLRTQRFATVQTTAVPRQNERVAARDLLATLPPGSLILADLGYFGFRWFDDLTDGGYHFVSKCRQKTSVAVVHVLAAGHTPTGPVRDELVWLGTHRADRAKHLVRRITVPVGRTAHVYLTNVLDPATLPIADVVRLYARRWDIETAFKTVKRDLGLSLLWSARCDLLLIQVWGVLLLAQIASALRADAHQAGRVFDVSLTLLLRSCAGRAGPGLGGVVCGGGRALGYIRPSRRIRWQVPTIPLDQLTLPPPELVTERDGRYAGCCCGRCGTDRRLV